MKTFKQFFTEYNIVAPEDPVEPFNELQRLYHWGIMQSLMAVGADLMDHDPGRADEENWETVDFALHYIREQPWREKIKDVGLGYVKDKIGDRMMKQYYNSDVNLLEDHFNDYFNNAVLDILNKHGANKLLAYLSA